MERAPDAGDTTDFRFEKLSELVAWSSDKEKELSIVVRGLAVTNKYGYIVCVCEKGFYVVDNGNFGSAVSGGDDGPRPLQDCGAFVVSVDWQPTLVAFSSTGLTLAVCVVRDGVPVVLLYDTRAFVRRNPNTQPFHTIILSNEVGNKVADFAWIPLEEEAFVVVLRDGSLGLFEIKAGTQTTLNQLGKEAAAVSVSWSPKGKQFVVGRPDGSLIQFKPDLTAARIIPGPKGQAFVCLKVVWLSTFVFAVSYMKSGDTQPIMVIVNAPKVGDPVFTDFGDVSAGFSDQHQRQPFYHFWAILEWKMLLAASNTGPEVGVLACQSEDETTGWLQLTLDENGRADMPLVGNDESFPLGMVVLTCTPVPVLVVVTTLGLVVSFRIVNQLKIKNVPHNQAICSAPKNIQETPGERPQLKAPPKPLVQAPVEERKSMPIPVPAAFSAAPPATQSPLQQSTNQSVAPSFGSSGLFGGGTAKPVTDSNPFTQSLFSGGSSSFGGFGAPKSEPNSLSSAPSTSVTVSATIPKPVMKPAGQPQPVMPPATRPAVDSQAPTILTTVISTKPPLPTPSPDSPTAKPPAGPTRIPSKGLMDFMRSVAAHGRLISELKQAPEPSDQLAQRMTAIVEVLDNLTAFYNDAALDLSRKERILEERLHVVEEAMLVVERCSDPEFRECLKLLPLDPMRRRQYEDLEDRLTAMENRLKSLESGVDLELDMLEEKKASPGVDQQQMTRRLIKELEDGSLKLQKRVHDLEKKVRRMGINRSFRPEPYGRDVSLSPAEVVSRLYPSLAPAQPQKIPSDVLFKLRQNLKSQPPRITKHEIVLFQRGKADAPPPSLTSVKPKPAPAMSSSSVTTKAAEAEKSFNALWNMKMCSPEPSSAVTGLSQPSTPSPTVKPEKSEPIAPKTSVEPRKAASGVESPSPPSFGFSAPPQAFPRPAASPTKPPTTTEPFTGGFGVAQTVSATGSFGGFTLSGGGGQSATNLFTPSTSRPVVPEQPDTVPEKPAMSKSPVPAVSVSQSSLPQPPPTPKTEAVTTKPPNNMNLSGLLASVSSAALEKPAETSQPPPPPLSSFTGFGSGSFALPTPTTTSGGFGATSGGGLVSTGGFEAKSAGMFGSPVTSSQPGAKSASMFSQVLAASTAQGSPDIGPKKSPFSTGLLGDAPVDLKLTPTSTTDGKPTPLFAGLSFGSTGGFGSSITPSSGSGPSVTPSTGFGSSTTPSSGFGSSTTSTIGFGSTTAPSTGFGSSATPSTGFGSSTPASGGFGSSTTPSSGFGSSAAPSSGSGFGTATSTSFGTPTTQASGLSSGGGFGTTSSTPSTGFGLTASPATGFGAASGFGQPGAQSASVFGQALAGSTAQPGAQSASVFGQALASSGGFGQSTTSGGGFGSSSAFGSGGFGSQQPATSQAAPPLASFGGFNISGATPSASAFSSPQSTSSGFGAAPAFGSSAFGSPSAFGSAQQPAQQIGSSYIWGSPGGFASYSQQPSMSFGTVAAQSSQSAGFGGSQPQGFGQQTGGFGSSTPQQQGGFGGGFGTHQGGFGAVAQQPSGFGGNQSGSIAPAQPNTFMQYR